MVIVNLFSFGFTVILLVTEAVVRRCFLKIVSSKNGFQTCDFMKKRFRYRFFTVKFTKFLRTPFLRNTSGGCFFYDSETYNTVKLICLLILISFQFKLHMVLINLIKVNHLTYCVQEKIPKIKRFQYVKS